MRWNFGKCLVFLRLQRQFALVLKVLLLLVAPTFANTSEVRALKPGETLRFILTMAEDAGVTRLEISEHAAVEFRPDKEGVELFAQSFTWGEEDKKWSPGQSEPLVFWAKSTDTRALKNLEGIPPRSWRGKALTGVLHLEPDGLQVWLEGQLVLSTSGSPGKESLFKFTLGKSVDLQLACEPGKIENALLLPVDLGHLTRDSITPVSLELDGIAFEARKEDPLSLQKAEWPEWKEDPWFFYEQYDAGVAFIGDRRIPMIQVPKADYLAAHVLAFAEDDGALTNRITLRAGRRIGGATNRSQVVLYDFPGEIPRGGGYHRVRIPFTEAFAQDVEGPIMDIELTKELRLARRSPDPNRFRWRPVGPASGVRIAAITLEKSPLQFEWKAGTEGSLFEAPERPNFTARLTNISGKEQIFKLEILVDGKKVQTLEGTVAAGATAERRIEFREVPLGHHTLEVAVSNAGGKLFSRNTFFGSLPADTRKYRDESPLGTWDFGGAHFTSNDFELNGALYRKLGFRYGLFDATPELRKKLGILRGNEYAIHGTPSGRKALEGFEKLLKTHPDALRTILVFHEDSLSGPHVTRVPDLFHDLPAYELNAEEKEKFDKMVTTATDVAEVIRAKYPDVKFSLGNGPLALREEFYRNKFPSESFDFAGNEAGSFGRPPETQPPDSVANNASLWMDRQLLDAYGYSDKAINQCFEITYPGTNPGNLSYQTQADYFVRHILHSMAWRIPQIRVGGIMDVGNSYYFSNWGSSSFFTARPRIEPKPSAVAVATLSTALDGATYDGFVETESESAYLLRFRKKDGSQVLPHWVVRGTRDFRVKLDGLLPQTLRLIAGNGASNDVRANDGAVTFSVSPTPGYLELPPGVTVASVSLGQPKHAVKPSGTVTELDSLSSLEGWEVGGTRNPELETYNPLTPRRKGRFLFEPLKEFEGEKNVLQVTPQPIEGGKPTMPMYAELNAKKEIILPGEPAEIGLWVNGNSAWGRIIFELEDATGQRWTSIGAPSKEGSAGTYGIGPGSTRQTNASADWNTDDSFGLSRINFDGWRYVGFPLPGQYPGEGVHWPANAFWKWTSDGVVHYPLKLRKLIVELPEKTLYLTRFEAAKRSAVYLRNLVVVERDLNAPKSPPTSYLEAAQINPQ